ncbi:hypothetical protein F2Q69_00003028 [Brassica cretica]|uniref:C-JID domain-containing protein n=1 Tax=Brassica cretica TaxID=69181 RepID=A0A8S9NY88_BRACR|nr:hypothetical protein F2Q69_00003028 [Brassica cretica]
MHRLLEQMGREIVKKQSMENPGKPHFLTDTDISDVLDENTATGNVLGIMLCTSEKIRICISAIQGMSNLKFLYFNSSIFWIPQKLDFLPHILDCLPDKLILLHWNVCPLRFWPSKFSGKFLVELVMQYSQFEMLWEGTKPLPCLKMLDLSSSWNLKKIPDLSKATSLEELCLHDCRSLLELTSYIENATRLYRLDISGCTKIKDFPNVSDSMVELNLSETGIKEVPPWIEKLFHLHREENLFEAIIKWGPDFKRSWRLRSDFFDVDYILPICLPEKALTSPITLRLCSKGIKTIPDCIRCLAGLTELDVGECRRLVALPPLPDSLLYLDAQGCESLKRIDSYFENPKICLNFDNCSSLKQKARKLIQTSACKYAVLPGEEVPAHFTHRASSGSLTINSTQRPLPSSFRFRACILLSKVDNHLGDNNDEWGESSLTTMSYSVRSKQNGRTVGSGSNQLQPDLYGNKEHLYIFEDFFTLNQDCPEAEGTTFTFLFRVHDKTWKVNGCGVRLLEVPHCILDGKETEDQECEEEDMLLVIPMIGSSEAAPVPGIFSSAFRFASSAPPLPLCDIKASAQEQIEYMITEDDDAPLLIADEVIKLQVKECVKSLFARFVQSLEEVTSKNGLSLKMVVSDLSWAFQILTKMEMVRDFVVTWVETSEKLVKLVEAMETGAETVDIRVKVTEVTSKVVEVIGYGTVILPSSDEAEILTEWLSKNGVYPDLTEAFEVWCYRSKVAKRRLGLLGGEEDGKDMS